MVFGLKGSPIGGMLSKVAASCTLACEEHAWCFDTACRRQHGFSQQRSDWDAEVARGRYVDDVMWVSGLYSHACLRLALSLAYSSVQFEVE